MFYIAVIFLKILNN